MPKRKRTERDGEFRTISKGKAAPIQVVRLEHKIEHGVVLLHRALKTARGFERQKLGRRQKTARLKKEDVQLARLGEEVASLKGLDLHATAERHLIKQLVKTKRIAESPLFTQLDPAKQTLPQDGPKEGPGANVVARLINSNPVRNVLPGIINGIRDTAGVGDVKAGESTLPQGSETSTAHLQEGHKGRSTQSVEDVSMGVSGEDLDQFEQFDDRIASTESEPESGVADNLPAPVAGPGGEASYDHARDLSLSPTPSEEGSESQSPPATSQKISQSKQASTATTFLPSLTMGGYLSGSESEPEDDDALQPVRKNRMGQQARRKLWEKKYGAGAKHIREQENKQGQSRGGGGWDRRRGATGPQGKGKGKGKGGVYPRSQPLASKPGKDEQPKKSAGGQSQNKQTVDEKPLHPSWEAARKAKEQKPATFQGKKVVFD